MFRLIVEYKVKPKSREQFEQLFGPKGERVKLFSRAKGYLGSELLLDDESQLAYIAIDFWESEKAQAEFAKAQAAAMDKINQQISRMVKGNDRIWME